MGYEHILYRVKHGAATIIINRPPYNCPGIKKMPARESQPLWRRGDTSGRGHRGRRI
jgi:hypothetical protein